VFCFETLPCVNLAQVRVGEQAAGVAQRVNDRLVDRLRVDVPHERVGAELRVGDDDGRRLLDVDAAGDATVLGDLLDRRGLDRHAAVPAIDLGERLVDRLVVGGLAVPEQQHQHLPLADRLGDRLREPGDVGLGARGGGLRAARLRSLGRGLRAGGGLAGVDPVDALLLCELPVGGRDGALGGLRGLARLALGGLAGLDVRSRLGRRHDGVLGTEEQHVGAQERDGADEEDSNRRGDLAHAPRIGTSAAKVETTWGLTPTARRAQ
jgi:hypothetical protein